MKQTFLIITLLCMGLFSCTNKPTVDETTEAVEVVDTTLVETDTTEVVELTDSTTVTL